MIINFKCKGCGQVFDCDIGTIGINDQTFRPVFEKQIICPGCGEKGLDDVLLTELGESQMTEATMDA
jgi:rubredoxin